MLAESVDASVRGVRGIIAVASSPPLSVIPYMRNSEDLQRAAKVKKTAIIAFTAAVVLVVVFVHLFVTPLDVLWFKGLRKVNSAVGG